MHTHPNYNVIIQTHSYLDAAGAISTSNGGYGANAPRVLFDRLVKAIPQRQDGVLRPHRRRPIPHRSGVGGNKIASFLQAFHSKTTNPVRLMTINTFTGTLTTRIYAPYTNRELDAVQRHRHRHAVRGLSSGRPVAKDRTAAVLPSVQQCVSAPARRTTARFLAVRDGAQLPTELPAPEV